MFSRGVIGTHFFVPKREVNADALSERLTIHPRFGSLDGIPVYKETDSWFGFPLYYQRNVASDLMDIRTSGNPLNLKFTGTPRDYQIPALDRFDKALKKDYRGFILHAPTGWGKTCVMISMIVSLNNTALIIVPKSDLIKQWIERFQEITNIKKSEIGFIRSRKAVWQGKKVVIALAHSLAIDYLPKEFYKNFGQVWYDEVHASTPPKTFAPISCMFPSKYRGGASATLDRVDGMHKIFELHCQQIKIVGRGGPEDIKPIVYLADYPYSCGEIPSYLRNMARRGVLISMLAEDTRRNYYLCKRWIHRIYKKDRQQVIMSDRIEQLHKLAEIMIQQFHVPKKEIGFYYGSIAEKEREKSANVCEILFATYGMLKMGTDIPNLSAIIYATPQSDTRQSEGRIRRLLQGKARPLIVDIRDPYYQNAKRWRAERMKRYHQNGFILKYKS